MEQVVRANTAVCYSQTGMFDIATCMCSKVTHTTCSMIVLI